MSDTPGCARVERRLPALVDGSLPELEAARDHGHLEACLSCAGAFQAHLRLLEGLRATSRVAASDVDALCAEVMLRLPARLPARSLRGLSSATSPALAAAAAAVLVCLWTTRGLPDTPRVTQLVALDSLYHRLPDWRLPDWSGLLRGLGDLWRPLS